MNFEQWFEKTMSGFYGAEDYKFVAQAAWQAAQTSLIQKAWNMYGEDLAEGLMELAGITVECPPEEEELLLMVSNQMQTIHKLRTIIEESLKEDASIKSSTGWR